MNTNEIQIIRGAQMKTAYRIAKDIGVSYTSVKRKMTSDFLSDYKRHIIKHDDGVTELDETAEQALIEMFKGRAKSPDEEQENSAEVPQTGDSNADSLLEVIKMLNEQLREKDAQIQALIETVKLQAESINTGNKNELAETIIEGKTLIDSGSGESSAETQGNKGGMWQRIKSKWQWK